MKRLDACIDCRLALVVAPAASGKTTLLRRWAKECSWPVAWVTLEAADNTPRRFLKDLLAAVQAIGVTADTMQTNGLGEATIAETMVDLINAIVETKEDWALVLDSYEVIEAPEIHEGVRLLLDYLPPRMHVVIASRAEPPLQLPRLRVRRQLLELRPQDLAQFRADSAGQPS